MCSNETANEIRVHATVLVLLGSLGRLALGIVLCKEYQHLDVVSIQGGSLGILHIKPEVLNTEVLNSFITPERL